MDAFEKFIIVYCYTSLALIVIIPTAMLVFGYLEYKFKYGEEDENIAE